MTVQLPYFWQDRLSPPCGSWESCKNSHPEARVIIQTSSHGFSASRSKYGPGYTRAHLSPKRSILAWVGYHHNQQPHSALG
jgi:hypothetical protein